MEVLTDSGLQQRLKQAGIVPTRQRMALASVLLSRPVHLNAEQVMDAARHRLPGLSRATVYAVLQLFVRQGLLKELPINGATTVYDSNIKPHHHICDIDTGEVVDLPLVHLQVVGLTDVLGDMDLTGVDVIVRVRRLDTSVLASPLLVGAT